MGTLYTRPYGFQIRITHKLMHQLEGLLAQGIVPEALLERSSPRKEIWTVRRCVLEYLNNNSVPLSDQKLLDTILPSVQTLPAAKLNYDWAEKWISDMKRVHHLAPSTIRHRHGALARCFDWICRRHAEVMVQNPLRLLKRGFATYTDADAEVLAKIGQDIRVDEERDRRLYPDEESRFLAHMHDQLDERIFFELARDTAMRMRECYTIELP
jgi:hypothetical protein